MVSSDRMPSILSLGSSTSFVFTGVVAYIDHLFQIRAQCLIFSSPPLVPVDHKVDLGVGATVNRVFYGRRHVCAIFNGGLVKVRIARGIPQICATCFTPISPYTSGTSVSFQRIFKWKQRFRSPHRQILGGHLLGQNEQP